MLNRCRLAVNAGRQSRGLAPLTDVQVQAIDNRLSATMRRLADPKRGDPQWQSKTPDIRMLEAAQAAMRDIEAEAARKVANAQAQVLKTAELETRIQDEVTAQLARGATASRAGALVHDFDLTNAYIDGIKRDNTRQLMDLISAADNRQGASVGRQALMILFDAQNPVMTRDLALEVFAKGNAGTGNAAAKAGAQAWLKVTEDMRQRFNAAGGDVGQLDYGYLPQAHDQIRVLAKGRDQWAADVLPLLDRTRYLREDGSRMNDAEVTDFLRAAWETISSDGLNNTAPGAFRGAGARANRGSQSRELHFADGAAYLDYQRQFGTGSMYDAMIGHIGALSRDIALVERYGPNPEAQMRVQFDLVEKPVTVGGQIKDATYGPEAQWRVLSGLSGTPKYASIARIGQHMRNIQTFSKLQGAVLSSITDLGTYFVTTGFNKLSYWDAFKNIGGAMTKDTREFLNTHGLIAESMISDLNRWAGENVAQSWSGRIASATMRLSLMNAWTDTLRRGFQLTMMQGTARLREKTWAQLAEYDQWRLSNKGITPDDWEVIRSAQTAQLNGADFITPDGIYATGSPRAGEVVAKYLGMISDESEVAVLNPDLTTRTIVTAGGSQAGGWGEFGRFVAQFKSFPIAMISRHMRRMLQTPQGLEGAPVGFRGTSDAGIAMNRLAYAGAFLVTMTALGAIAFQAKQMVSGKDPVNMDPTDETGRKFWVRAMAQGGGLGFIGDLLLNDQSDDMSRQQWLFDLLGPTAGSIADLGALIKGNYDQWAAGKETNAAAEAIRFARSHLPLLNLWYAKTAIDQAGLHALQEAVNPGYLARIQNKARKDWQQEFWWAPGTGLPDRAPDLAAIGGP